MLLFVCLSLVLTGVAGQDQPLPSPCPGVFQFSYDGGRWTGLLTVPVPPQPKRMVVVASLFVIDVLLPPEHSGELQLLQDERKVKEQIRRNQTNTVVYVLELPIQSPLPVIDKIKVNRNLICQGPAVKARNRTKVTYTHRLNGLRPQSPDKLGGQPNEEQGRMIGLDPKKFNEQGIKAGTKGKNNAFNNLELMENEVVEIMTQEEDIFPKYKTQGRGFNTELDLDNDPQDSEDNLDSEWSDGENVDEDFSLKTRFNNDDEEEEEDVSGNDLDLNQDAEMPNKKIPGAVSPRVENTPDAKTPDISDEDFDDDDEEQGTSDNVIDPNKDAEMLDNNIPEASNHNVPNKPIDEAEDDYEDEDEEEEEDTSDIDLDLTEDVEMLDNKVSETGGSKPKNINPGFNIEEFDDFSDNELDPNFNNKMSDNDIYP